MFLDQVCEPDEVLGHLLAGGAGSPVRQGQILIMLQGRIFIEDEQIFVQSRLRGFRRQSPADDVLTPLQDNFDQEALSVRLDRQGRSLTATLPVFDITFTPRVISEELFEQINLSFVDASRVFAEPTLDATNDKLVFHADRPQAFSVRIADEPGWIEVEDIFGGHPSGGFIRVIPRPQLCSTAVCPSLIS